MYFQMIKSWIKSARNVHLSYNHIFCIFRLLPWFLLPFFVSKVLEPCINCACRFPFPFPFLPRIVEPDGSIDLKSGKLFWSSRSKEMEIAFRCPVCLSLPICSIYQCKKGHLVCRDCFDKMTQRPLTCPTCRDPMTTTPIRSLAAEQVICTFKID